ncbi:PucR family transcriptional regulator [Streptomyces sp. NPDC001922]|uniref:PucR family transcriptional regulator n=1 Tax=Streptomyces sp. NPDC001922 TaxID=3364624 RepID=UPI0036C1DA3C
MTVNGTLGPDDDAASEPTLESLLSVMGTGALELCVAPCGLKVPVAGVTLFDPLEPGMPPGQVVLAVGIDPQSALAVDCVRDAGRAGTVAVVFGRGGTGPAPAALRAAAEDAGTAVLFRTAWFGWTKLMAELRAGLFSVGLPADPALAGVALGDLNALADATAALVGGSVTVEDMESRVLAYSSTEEDVDELRRRTILGRRVPQWRVAAMQEAGFFRALWGSGDVIHRPEHGENPERLVVAVRAGGEVLGSIWVAAAGRSLAPNAADALRSAARMAAVHLVHHRCHRGQARLVEEAARALLDGRGPAEVLAERAAFPPHGHSAVLAVRTGNAPGGVDHGKLTSLLGLQCTAYGHQTVVVTLDGGALVLLGTLDPARQRAEDQVARLGAALVRQLSEVFGTAVRIGLGTVVGALAELPESRRSAELAVRALLSAGGDRAVAFAREVAEAVALNQVMDALEGLAPAPETPVARLVELDAKQGGGTLLETLRVHLDHFGDVPAAARVLGVHANSLRYRIRRLTELSGIDLRDPDARLLAHLQLRLLARDDGSDGERPG